MFSKIKLLTAILIALSSFNTKAERIPNSFEEINIEFLKQKYNPTTLDNIIRKAYKGRCYYSSSDMGEVAVYLGAIMLGKDIDKKNYEFRIGLIYEPSKSNQLNSNQTSSTITKGDVFDILTGWWSHLPIVSYESPLIVNFDNFETTEFRGQSPIYTQAILNHDVRCEFIDPKFKPLCKNGVIPQGTHIKSCVFSEELK